jgi:hypothetical protein
MLPTLGMTAAEVVRNIGSALTPVVVITVAAILATGLGGKHAQLAMRMRDLTAELRDGATPQRRRSILAQLGIFDARLLLAHSANVLIYTGALALVLLVILLTLESTHGAVDAALFVSGLVCIFAAIALEIGELLLANRTMARELNDCLNLPSEMISDLENNRDHGGDQS